MKTNVTLALLAVLLLAALLLAYSNHFHNPFEFDDAHTIVNNAAIRDLRNIPRFFTDTSTTSSLPQNSDYRPGLTTLNAIDYAIAGGLDPFYFHRSIFISYVFLGLLLYLLYVRIGAVSADRPWIRLLALCAAGWFLLLTANAETVNYIIQRGDSFSTLMVVLGLVIYAYRPGWRKYHIYLIPMVAGVLVKLPALMFAPLLFIYDLLFERSAGLTQRVRRSSWPQAARSFTVALPAFTVALLLLALNRAMCPASWSQFSTPRLGYLITQPFVIIHYANNFFLPLQLSVDTDWQVLASPVDDRFFAGMAFIGVMLAVAACTARRRAGRPIAFGILWFFVALLPTSLVPLDEVLNDHRPFFAYIGLVLACSWAAGLLVMRYEQHFTRSRLSRVVLGSLVALLLLGNAYGVYRRNQVWSSPESLWYDATLKSPGNARALMNYGLAQLQKNDPVAALDTFQRALAMAPGYSYIHTNLGVTYAALDRPEDAERHFKNALQLAPRNPEVYYHYARWLGNQSRIQEAQAMAGSTLALSPGHAPALQLAAHLRSPGLHDSLINDSLAHYNAGAHQKSIQAAQAALAVQPDSALAYNNICAANNRLKRWDAAIKACRHALAIQPGFTRAQNNLKLAELGRDSS